MSFGARDAASAVGLDETPNEVDVLLHAGEEHFDPDGGVGHVVDELEQNREIVQEEVDVREVGHHP